MAEPDPQQQTPRGIRVSRTWLTMLLVVGAAAVTIVVMDRRSGPADLYGVTTHLDEEADFFMEMAEIEQYRADGSLEYLMLADGVHHFEREALTQLTQPQFTLHREQGSPWHASARNGVLRRPPAGGIEEVLALSDDVVLEQTLPDGGWMRLSTPSLRVYPRRQYAETDQDVMIDSLMGRTTATGLEGDLQLGILNFLSMGEAPVSTVLQPEQFK